MDKLQKLRNELKRLVAEYGSETVETQLHKVEPYRTRDKKMSIESAKMFRSMTKAERVRSSTKERFLKSYKGHTISVYIFDGKFTMSGIDKKAKDGRRLEFVDKIDRLEEVLQYFFLNGWEKDIPEENSFGSKIYNDDWYCIVDRKKKERDYDEARANYKALSMPVNTWLDCVLEK